MSEEDCDFGDTDECVMGSVANQQQPIKPEGNNQRSATPHQVKQTLENQKSPQLTQRSEMVTESQRKNGHTAQQYNSSKRNVHQGSMVVPTSDRKNNELEVQNENQQAYYATSGKTLPHSKSQQNLYGTSNNFQTISSTSQMKDDPEIETDFNKAYLKLVQKVYQEQGTNILITQDELNRIAYNQQHLSIQDFQQRNIQMLENKQQKVKLLEEMKKTQEMQECTFKPVIYSKTQKDKRNFDQFLKDQAQFDEQRRKKTQERAEQNNILKQQELKYMPQVNKKSAKIVEVKKRSQQKDEFGEQQPDNPIYQRLHNMHQEKMQKQLQKAVEMNNLENTQRIGTRNLKKTKSEANFTSARSRERESGKTVDEMLYEDAKRRWEKQEQKKKALEKLKDEQIQATKPPTGLNNLKYAASKFEKEFYYAIYTVIGEQVDDNMPQEIDVKDFDEKRLNYVKLGQLMSEMGYLPLNVAPDSVERELLFDMWNMLQGEENNGISVINTKKILLAVQGISIDAILSNYQGQTGDKNAPIQLNDYDESGVLRISQAEVNKIFLKFKPLYINRVHHIGLQKRIKHVDNNCTFKPHISKNTEQLAQNRRIRLLSETRQESQNQPDEVQATPLINENEKVDIVSILLHPVNADSQWKQNAREILQAKELQECTFKPKILNYDSNKVQNKGKGDKCLELYQKAKALKEKKDKTQNEYEFEKAKEQCTFQPNIEESQKNMEVIYYTEEGRGDFIGELTQHIKGYQRTMARLKKGREGRERQKVMQQRGIPGTVLDESLLQPLQFQSNQTYKGVFSTYQHSTDSYYNSQQSKINQTQTTSAQNKLAPSKSTERLFKMPIKNESTDRRLSSARGFQKKSNQPKSEKENINYNNEMMGGQSMNSKSFISNTSQQQQQPPQPQADNGQKKSRYSDYNRNPSNDYSYDSEERRMTGGSIVNTNLQQDNADFDALPTSTLKSSKQPLLYVDVNLGPGKSERIVVFDGDTADSLAEKFAQTHGLDTNMRGKLAQLLESQISGLLEKIEEEQNSIHSDNI